MRPTNPSDPGFFPDDRRRPRAADKPTSYQPELEPEETYRNPAVKPDDMPGIPDDVWQRVRSKAEAAIAIQRDRRQRRAKVGQVLAQLGLLTLSIGLILAAAGVRRPAANPVAPTGSEPWGPLGWGWRLVVGGAFGSLLGWLLKR